MALDLVRWSSLRASLVKARNEAHLLRTLDELADPSECTWQRYEGPLWVDFEVPAKFEVQPTGRSRLELSDVQVSLPAHDWAEPLRIVSAESETEAEMLHAILEDAFPSIAEVIDASGADDPSKSELESAIVRELVEHHNRTAKQGVTFESDADGDLELRATRFQYFLWKETRFEPIDDEIIDAFLFGERSMEGGVDHKVRLASAAIALHQGKPQFVAGVHWRAFGVSANGIVVEPHRADAFPIGEGEEPSPFFRSRNSAVRWSPGESEIKQLKEALRAHFGEGLRVSELLSADAPL